MLSSFSISLKSLLIDINIMIITAKTQPILTKSEDSPVSAIKYHANILLLRNWICYLALLLYDSLASNLFYGQQSVLYTAWSKKFDRCDQLARVKLLANQLNIEFPSRNYWNMFRINDVFMGSNLFFSTSARNIWKIGQQEIYETLATCISN